LKQFEAESLNMVRIRMRELQNNPLKTKLVARICDNHRFSFAVAKTWVLNTKYMCIYFLRKTR
jgi:hypothetical protein